MSVLMNRLFLLSVFLVFLGSCTSEKNKSGIQDPDLSDINVSSKVHRFDLVLDSAIKAWSEAGKNPDAWHSIYVKHFQAHEAFLFDLIFFGDTASYEGDSSKGKEILEKIIGNFCYDSNTKILIDSVKKYFPEDYSFNSILEKPLKRTKYYFPQIKIPVLYSHISGYSPNSGLRDQSFHSPDFYSFSLDYFLGDDFTLYPGDLPKYLRRRCRPDFIPVSYALVLSNELHPEPGPDKNPTLLDYMLNEGIRSYIVEILVPEAEDSTRLSYSSEQIAWAEYHESRIYNELLPLLFSTEYLKFDKYLRESPFTANLAQESAPRIAQYCGLQIIRKLMREHPEITPAELVKKTNYKELFELAAYRPKD